MRKGGNRPGLCAATPALQRACACRAAGGRPERWWAARHARVSALCCCAAQRLRQGPAVHRQARCHPAIKAGGHVEEAAVAGLRQQRTRRRRPQARLAAEDQAGAAARERGLDLQGDMGRGCGQQRNARWLRSVLQGRCTVAACVDALACWRKAGLGTSVPFPAGSFSGMLAAAPRGRPVTNSSAVLQAGAAIQERQLRLAAHSNMREPLGMQGRVGSRLAVAGSRLVSCRAAPDIQVAPCAAKQQVLHLLWRHSGARRRGAVCRRCQHSGGHRQRAAGFQRLQPEDRVRARERRQARCGLSWGVAGFRAGNWRSSPPARAAEPRSERGASSHL